MLLKIMTLNYWRYYELDQRLANIINAIQREKPDVICFQEMQIDSSHSPFSQVELLKSKLSGWDFSLHSTIYAKTHQRGSKLPQPVQHGMAVLSRCPIINSFEYYLSLSEEETEPRSILCFDIKLNIDTVKLANIHFANREKWAKAQLEEFLNYLNSRKERRIMAGDFNSYQLSQYQPIYHGYTSSYDIKPYISYPKDNWCLDYVLIPDSYKFTGIKLLDEYLSDHKGLIADISIS